MPTVTTTGVPRRGVADLYIYTACLFWQEAGASRIQKVENKAHLPLGCLCLAFETCLLKHGPTMRALQTSESAPEARP